MIFTYRCLVYTDGLNDAWLAIELEGAKAVSSFCILSVIPGNIVVPPERVTFP